MAETQVVYSLYILDKVVSEINSQQDQQINLQIVEGAEDISEFGEHWTRRG